MLEVLTTLDTLCPTTILHARRIVRMTEERIGTFELNSNSLFELGIDNIGLLVGGASSPQFLIERIADLAEVEMLGTLVVAASSKKMADWCYKEIIGELPKRGRPDIAKKGSLTLTTLEKLGKITSRDQASRPVLAIVLLDPLCHVHTARGDGKVIWDQNDRPQFISRFQFEHRNGDWVPPLVLLTARPAKSLNTVEMLSPYGLNAWWFLNATTLRSGPCIQLAEEHVSMSERQ